MDRPALILQGLGIPAYLVWDGDEQDESGVRSNRILQRIVGVEPVDYPESITPTFTVFRTKLEKKLREELAPAYDKEVDNCKGEFGYADRKRAEKNPRVLAEVIRRAAAIGKTSTSLETIVDHILLLHTQTMTAV